MTIVLTNPGAVVNYALAKIGYRLRVGSLLDGSMAAKKALDVYGQCRDALIMGGEWDFVQREVSGTLLKSAPASYAGIQWTTAYPQQPWKFEYSYPTDAVRIRSVKASLVAVPNYTPRYNRFEIANDQALSGAPKVILCDVPLAIVEYAGQITDPTQWDELFLETLADKLGVALGKCLVDVDAVKLSGAEAAADRSEADRVQG